MFTYSTTIQTSWIFKDEPDWEKQLEELKSKGWKVNLDLQTIIVLTDK